jgi:hypothetical protein
MQERQLQHTLQNKNLSKKQTSLHAKNVKMKKYIIVISQNKDEKMHPLELPQEKTSSSLENRGDPKKMKNS